MWWLWKSDSFPFSAFIVAACYGLELFLCLVNFINHLFCGKIYHFIVVKFPILTILKYMVQGIKWNPYCCALLSSLSSPELYFKTKTLSSLSNNSSFSWTAHGNYHFTFCLEKWNIACCISKPKMAQLSAITAIADGELVSPEGTGRKEHLPSSSHQTAATP